MEIIPKTGFKGLIENWQSDLIAAVSVSLVALPLALGIAMASGVTPIAGVLSAIIGGIVTTFFRGSHVAINGPTAGLIAVILASVAALDDGSGHALHYVFAAIVVSGAIQVILGLLRLGRFADLFHSTVIHGILAAIGLIIIAKQIHVALGTTTESQSIIDALLDAFRQIPNINPFVAGISLAGLLLLIFHSRISYKFFHFLPAPMWVLVISIPFAFGFDFFNPHDFSLFGKTYHVGPELLINIPDNILDAIIYPDFSKIYTLPFWMSVLSITMIASIESLASGKAIDKLDPYKRKTKLNKDLIGIGVSTMVSGALGGLPIINVIVRSTVNVHNHAKTKWSNLYHGILLLIFILLLAPVIQKVPLAALAVILVYTGFKLASPKVFKHVLTQGIEQLIFFVGTLVITLLTDLLIGVFSGLLLALIVHFLLARVPVRTFFEMIFNSGSELISQEEGSYDLKIKGIANFLATIKIDKLLGQIPAGTAVNVNLSAARLVDFSILEHLYDFQRTHVNTGGKVQITGLNNHTSSSSHKFALKFLAVPLHKLTPRQVKLEALAADNDWDFEIRPANQIDYFHTFDFFKSRQIEKRLNVVFSNEKDIDWEINDVLFEEGALISYEEYKTTLGVIKFPFQIPRFTIEKKAFPEKFLNLSGHKDIDYTLFHDFPGDFIVKVESITEMETFMSDELKELIKNSKVIHHLESNGRAILLFTDNLRLARIRDYSEIVEFARKLKSFITA